MSTAVGHHAMSSARRRHQGIIRQFSVARRRLYSMSASVARGRGRARTVAEGTMCMQSMMIRCELRTLEVVCFAYAPFVSVY